MTSQNLDICLFLVYKKSVWIQSWWLWCGAGSQGTTRCFDSPPQGSHSTILNAMTHDFVPDALDRCTLGDLCLRHLPGPQEQISTVFFFFSAEGKWEAAISLFWEPVQMEPAKMQTLLTGSIFLQPNACSQKKFNRLLYWFVIPLQGFVCRLNILTRQVLSDSVSGHSFGNAYVCIARLMAYWDNISNDHLPSYTAVLIWSYF